jgi:hypothetical protein
MIIRERIWATTLTAEECRTRIAASVAPYSIWNYGFGTRPADEMFGRVSGDQVLLLPRTALRNLFTTPFLGTLADDGKGVRLSGRIRIVRALLIGLVVSCTLGLYFVYMASKVGAHRLGMAMFVLSMVCSLGQITGNALLVRRRVSEFIVRTIDASPVL